MPHREAPVVPKTDATCRLILSSPIGAALMDMNMNITRIVPGVVLTFTALVSACRSEQVSQPDPLPSGRTVVENSFSGGATYPLTDGTSIACSMLVSMQWDSTRTVSAREQIRFGHSSGDVYRRSVRASGFQELAAFNLQNAPARARVFGTDSIELTLWPESAGPVFATPLRVIKGVRTEDSLWKGSWSCAPTGRVAAPVDSMGLAVGTWQTLVLTVR